MKRQLKQVIFETLDGHKRALQYRKDIGLTINPCSDYKYSRDHIRWYRMSAIERLHIGNEDLFIKYDLPPLLVRSTDDYNQAIRKRNIRNVCLEIQNHNNIILLRLKTATQNHISIHTLCPETWFCADVGGYIHSFL